MFPARTMVYTERLGQIPPHPFPPEESAMRLTMLALLSALTMPLAGVLHAETVPIPATAPVSEGIELVMVDRVGCIYCAAWKAEVMPQYAATPEGRAAPLRIVDIDGPWPDGMALASRPSSRRTEIANSGAWSGPLRAVWV